MAQISVSGLSFEYEGSYDSVFENVSFIINSDWKLGLIGRNGKGKTTFLNLLLGKYEYQGTITTSVKFEYFPYNVDESMLYKETIQVIESIYPEYELWKICRELEALKADCNILYRQYNMLSQGEKTKVMLSLLFSKDNMFLLIDEPTNHLDFSTREILRDYLNTKKGFILVSHDRWLLDECVDHVLVLNRKDIEVEKGNFGSWWENKEKQDKYELAKNKTLKNEIQKMEESSKRMQEWAEKAEKSKIGLKHRSNDQAAGASRAYIGKKSAKMQQRRKSMDLRQQKAIHEKSQLLKNIEDPVELKIMPLSHHKEIYVRAKDISLSYGQNPIFNHFNMEIKRGDRVVITGKNGCGKSSVVKTILSHQNAKIINDVTISYENCKRAIQGEFDVASGLIISYINQDTSFLRGKIDDYIFYHGMDKSIFLAILRQLDFQRVQFEKNMEEYSEGQKKKVLITSSLLSKAHLYIWDEPLNYIDVFSRIQIENLMLKYQPTILIVEHDKAFWEKIATKVIAM